MLKKTVTYVDYNGVERTEDFYFNFSKAELMEMELSTVGGFSERVKKIIDAKDQPSLIRLIKDFVLDAHGVKSEDGRRFMKNEDIKAAFVENPAYSVIFMELATNADEAAKFVNGVAPADIADKIPPVAPAN